jgi:hypothetical protein
MLRLSYAPMLLPAMEHLEQNQCLIAAEADDNTVASGIHTMIMAYVGSTPHMPPPGRTRQAVCSDDAAATASGPGISAETRHAIARGVSVKTSSHAAASALSSTVGSFAGQ